MKQQIKVNGQWHNVVAIHERNGERLAVFEYYDGLCTKWLHDGDMLELRTIDDDGHAPTPHSPCEGVTLWNTSEQDDYPDIQVDGECVGYLGGYEVPVGIKKMGWKPRPYKVPNTCEIRAKPEDLAAFRDKVRAERKAKAEPKADELDEFIQRRNSLCLVPDDVLDLARIVRDRLTKLEGK